MGTLGQHFPDEQKAQHVARNMLPGQILYLLCKFPEGPREKYLVLACTGQEPILFIVNSKPNEFILRTPELRACQVPLRRSDHAFLDHDSHINCAKPADIFDSVDEIEDQLRKDVTRIRGEITQATKADIVQAAMNSRLLTPDQKNAIAAALSP